ncbi:MAG TPA: beta-galactosidase [Chloroflexota bacterium]|nr:beta-galactosidase [Chloroflexota bacterium]
MGLWPAGLAAIALLVALGAVGANAPPARGQNPPLRPAPPALFGIAGHAWWLDEHFDTFLGFYRDLGVTGVRIPLDWKRFEPQEGQYDFSLFDRVFPRLAAAGLELTVYFVTVPAWATSNPAACEIHEQEFCDFPPSREAQYRAAVRAALTRYPFVRYWEVGNEPELWRRQGHDPADYLRQLRPFYEEAKALNPANQVAISTLTGWRYVSRLYELAPERPWDAVAYHPYGGPNGADAPAWGLASDDGGTGLYTLEMDRLHAEMAARGDATKPLWITEYGWERDPPTQAARLRAALSWMASRPWITQAHLHMLHDQGTERFGLTRLEPPGPITRNTRFIPKTPFYEAFKEYPRAASSPTPPPAR